MSSAGGGSDERVLRSANASTIQDKFMVGYQGWFTCAGDGEPVGKGHHGWLHWFNQPIPDGGRPNIDLWPDVSEYSASELFPAPGLHDSSGKQVSLFSSRNAQTVQRHFHWMAQHGVDGAFLQRFATEVEGSDEGIKRIRDEVCDRVREAAEKEGRVFAIMYDVTGVPAERIQQILQRDWIYLWRTKRILDSPAYLREKGKPVVALWGFGLSNRSHTPDLLRRIAHLFRNSTPSSAYIFGGAPAHWRTGTGDADPDPGFVDAWMEGFDAISPWTVGRYKMSEEADRWGNEMIKQDMDFIKERNAIVEAEGRGRKVDYVPVVLPGGSGYNLSEGKWGFNDIKRDGGKFLWKQIFNAKRHGVRIMYGAMWDEYDEGTAFLPVVATKRQLPESSNFPFLSLDEDGYELPSDWYMRICGFAAEGLRSERLIHETFPSKELQYYWTTRPRYEGDPIPTAVAGGSSTTSASGSGSSSDSAGGEGNAQEAYALWLSQQKEETDELPPPPYSLEASEEAATPVSASSSAPQQTGPESTSSVPAPSSPLPIPPQTSVSRPTSAAASGQVAESNAQSQTQGYSGQASSAPRPTSRPASRPGTAPSHSNSPVPTMPSVQALADDFGRQSISPGSTPAGSPWQQPQQQPYPSGPTTSPQPWQQQHRPYPQMTSPPPGQGRGAPSPQAWQQQHQPYPMSSPPPGQGQGPSQPYPYLSTEPKIWQQAPTPSPTSGHGRPVHASTLPPQQSWQQQQPHPPLPSPVPNPGVTSNQPQQQSYLPMPSPPAQPGNRPPVSPMEPQKPGPWSQGQWPPPEWNVKPSKPEPQALYSDSVQSQVSGLGRASSYTTPFIAPGGQSGLGRTPSAHASYQQPGSPPGAPRPPQASYPGGFPMPHAPSIGPSPSLPSQSPPLNRPPYQSPPAASPPGAPLSQFPPTAGEGYFNVPQRPQQQPPHPQQQYPQQQQHLQQQPQHYQQHHAPNQQYPHPPTHQNTYPGAMSPTHHSPPFNAGFPRPFGQAPGPGFQGAPGPPPPLPSRPYGNGLPPPPPPSHQSMLPYAQPPPGGPPDNPFGFATSTMDRIAGEERRRQLERGVENLAQSGSKLLHKFK